jgi:RNA polymerase sigma-70 factor (ECF subfamily)
LVCEIIDGRPWEAEVAMRDDEFLREVYEGSYRRLVTGMYGMCGDLGTAEEIVQEAFVRAVAGVRDFRRVDNPEAWLRRVAINIHHSRWRRIKHLSLLTERADPRPEVTAPMDVETDHVTLIAAMRRLPAAQREAIALHHLFDLSVAEVAALLNIPDGTVKARLSRGRAALAESLRETKGVRHV